MAHGDAREGKWRGNCRMEWVASTLHTTSEHGLYSIITADAHTSAASSRLNWRPPADLNRLVRFARKTKSGFCVCAITFQPAQLASDPNTNFSKISTCSFKVVTNINHAGGGMIVANKRNCSSFVPKIQVHNLPEFHSGYVPDDWTEVGIEYTHG